MSGGRNTSSTSSGARLTAGRPGISATPTPATTSKIDGAMCSRRAATATAASTAIINSTVSEMAVMSNFGSRGAKGRWGYATSSTFRSFPRKRESNSELPFCAGSPRGTRQAPSSNHARYHVHGQRQDRDVEEERQHAMHGRDAADAPAGDGDVGHL